MTESNAHQNSPDHTPPADQDWFGGRRWTGIAAIGVLILIALCVVIVVVLNRGGSHPSGAGSPTVTTSSASSPSSSSTGPASSSARPSPLPTTTPTAAPTGVAWTIYQTVALPSLHGAGPTRVHGAIATGYAHSPLGALLAVANESYRYVLAPDTEWRQAAQAMLADTPGKAVWLKNRAANPYGSGGPTSSGSGFAQIAGFQFVSYTPTDAVIQIVTRDSDGNLQVGADHVTWTGSDWRFVPASNGGINENVQQIDDLAGFIEWKGV